MFKTTGDAAKFTGIVAALAVAIGSFVAVGSADAAQCNFTFTKNFSQGSTGSEVMDLQKFLNMSSDTQVSSTGAGAPGAETTYFGALTRAAVIKFQEKYTADVLTPVGLTRGTGFWGASSRAKANALCAAMNTTTPPPTNPPATTTPSGSGVSIAPAAQPADSLAPAKAARVPFTRFTLTASNDGAITVTGIQVKRTGLAANTAFAGVVLLDENGNQVGIARTLNSNDIATVGETMTIPAGQSRTFTIAGNMATDLSANSGQIAKLEVVAVNTSSSVSGSLPISGASHTMNGTLSIGTISMNRGATDPNSNRTEEVGLKNYTFSSVRVTAGSEEHMWLRSVRFNQSGSASSQDLENIKIYVDGVAYTPVVSSDGKYYTANFGNPGIKIEKGFSKEIEIRGDVTGGSGRTVAFDIYRNTDIYVVGDTYGYGISAPTNGSTGLFGSSNPWFDASVISVSRGSLTVEKATSVAAQNIAENVANQPLGGFTIEAKGEPSTVQSMVFNLGVSNSSITGADITSVTLVDENGSVVAGPVDATTVSGGGIKVTFTDSVTIPVGKKVYTLKGRISTDFAANDTVTASTTPSTGWTNITGQQTGENITAAPGTAITSNTMTVKTGEVRVSVATTPAAQNIVSGGLVTFANYDFDLTNSGENLRMNTFVAKLTAASLPENLTSCQIFDGNTSLTTGSNAKTPSAAGDVSFSLDSGGIILQKGTVKRLTLKCNVAGGTPNGTTYAWGLQTAPTLTGLDSSSSVTATVTASNGQTMTVQSTGSLTVEKDSSSPSYSVVAAGTTGNVLGVLRLRANFEAIRLDRVGLELSNSSASSSPSDLTRVTIWDGATQVGEAIFTGANRFATTTLSGNFVIPKDGEAKLTLKADLASVGTSQSGTQGALIQVNYDGNDLAATRGIGMNSGSTITSSTATDTNMDGVRMFRAYPTLSKLSLSSNVLSNGTWPLLRFSVKANSGDVAIYKLTFKISTTTALVQNFNVEAFNDANFSTPVSGVSSNGRLSASDIAQADSNGIVEVIVENSAGEDAPLQIGNGSTVYFQLVGTVTGSNTGAVVSAQLEGDSAYPSLPGLMGTALAVDSQSHDDFIWSPNATSTSATSTADWTNGYGLIGLPGSNMSAEVLSR